AEDGIRDKLVTGVQTCALPISPNMYKNVMDNLHLLTERRVPHYLNSVITKYNTEEFINQTYFDRAKELGINAVSFTFVEDRSDRSEERRVGKEYRYRCGEYR